MSESSHHRPDSPKQEYFDVLDEQGNKTGQTKLRSAVHRDGDWHQAVNIWIVSPSQEILLQRRSATKDSWPGRLDVSCGGHVVAGETPLEAAISELREELGLEVNPQELEFLGIHRSSTRPALDFVNNSFNHVYILRRNFKLSDFILQDSEVAEVISLPLQELKQVVTAQNPDLVPHSYLYQLLFDTLDKDQH